MLRNHLVLALVLSLLTACSSVKLGNLGPHRIDVQQGNALDQESVAKLKPGLNRSQVRFLLGTPLLVDPFRNNRWDYVYLFYKRGKLTEQKRITLFFEDDILARMEGDIPVGAPALGQPNAPLAPPAAAAVNLAPSLVESLPLESVKKPEPVADAASGKPTHPAPTESAPVQIASESAVVVAKPDSIVLTPRAVDTARPAATSVVTPLSGSPSAPAYGASRSPADLQLHSETNVAQIRPDLIPTFPDPTTPSPPSLSEASVMLALKSWSDAWAQGNADAYIAAYAPDFLPPGGGAHADWEKRRRMLLGVAKNVELRIASAKVKMAADGHALVTFNQYYSSKNYRDDLVKQIRLAQHAGRWLIVDEQVVSTLQPPKP